MGGRALMELRLWRDWDGLGMFSQPFFFEKIWSAKCGYSENEAAKCEMARIFQIWKPLRNA